MNYCKYEEEQCIPLLVLNEKSPLYMFLSKKLLIILCRRFLHETPSCMRKIQLDDVVEEMFCGVDSNIMDPENFTLCKNESSRVSKV